MTSTRISTEFLDFTRKLGDVAHFGNALAYQIKSGENIQPTAFHVIELLKCSREASLAYEKLSAEEKKLYQSFIKAE